MSHSRVIVLLGAPLADLDAYGRELALGAGGVYLGDLNLAYGDTVDELLQVYELSQIGLHPPLLAALTQWAGHADPQGFLQANRHWSLQNLLDYLIAKVGSRQLIFSDAAAGFRVAMVDRWLQALPDADFVHASTDVQRFVLDAEQRYQGRLFIPPEYLDHSDEQAAPRFAPAIAWFHLHATLLRLLGEAAPRRCYRVALDRHPPHKLEDLQRSQPSATDASPVLQRIEDVALALGYLGAAG